MQQWVRSQPRQNPPATPAFTRFGPASQVLPPSSDFGATNRDAKLLIYVGSSVWRLP
jgi:hypothetical protein